MTPKQMALSRLARLALNAAAESPPSERAEVCRLVAIALKDECPDLAALATTASEQFTEAELTTESLLLKLNH